MAHEELQDASEALRKASEAADSDDARERLYTHSDELARLATADQGPDHGRLARVERQVSTVAEQTGGDVEAHVQEAISYIHAYREDLEGV